MHLRLKPKIIPAVIQKIIQQRSCDCPAQFHLEQAKQRARARLREERPKPIDLLARTLHLAAEFGIEPEPPHSVFDRLTLTEIRELKRGILDFQVGVFFGGGFLFFSPCSRRTAAVM